MIDLHTHTFLSDGVLIASELIQRARAKGYRAIALTDHADGSNMESVIKGLKLACADANIAYKDIKCLPGVEITHIAPMHVKRLTDKARKLGAKMVVFHGETVVEPVEPGSNLAAIKAKVDILAHPGRITLDEAKLAKKNNVALEITFRKGHDKTNSHVAKMALKAGAKLIFNTDAHVPNNLASKTDRNNTLKKAGLSPAQIKQVIKNSEELVRKTLK